VKEIQRNFIFTDVIQRHIYKTFDMIDTNHAPFVTHLKFESMDGLKFQQLIWSAIKYHQGHADSKIASSWSNIKCSSSMMQMFFQGFKSCCMLKGIELLAFILRKEVNEISPCEGHLWLPHIQSLEGHPCKDCVENNICGLLDSLPIQPHGCGWYHYLPRYLKN